MNSYFYCHDNFLNKQKQLTNVALTALLSEVLHLTSTACQLLRKTQVRTTLPTQTSASPLSTAISRPAFCSDKPRGFPTLPFNRPGDCRLAVSKYVLQFPLHALSFSIRFLLLGVQRLHGNSHSHRIMLSGKFTLESPVIVRASSQSLSLRIAPTLPLAFG